MNTPLPTTETPRRSRSTVLGVTAGLLAGGAIGLVATVPSLTSAATDESSLVVQQEDTGDTETGDDAVERPEAGERLRETLQPLVDSGTIDDSQADAVTEHLVENRSERDGRHGRRGQLRLGNAAAEAIGIEKDELRAELRDGQSIADVAEANGVDVQTVIDAMIADAEARIELAVEQGLDEDRAAERLERVTERIEEGVDKTKDDLPRHQG